MKRNALFPSGISTFRCGKMQPPPGQMNIRVGFGSGPDDCHA